MRKAGIYLLVGVIAGCVELAVCWFLAYRAEIAAFVDVTFFVGLFTLLLGGMALFRSVRTQGSGLGNPYNDVPQVAMNAQTAFDEIRSVGRISREGWGRLLGASLGSIGIFAAAAVVWIGFLVKLAIR